MRKIIFCLVIIAASLHMPLLHAQPAPMGICLENYAYPFPVHYIQLHLQQQEVKMAYMDVQPAKANGHTILLLHGKNFCGAYWGSTAKALQEKGYRVIIPDQVGFGKSSKPSQLQYSFQLLAQNTRALLDSLNIRQTVVLGHSMGGMLATRFALMYPELTEKLVLEDPIGLEDWKLKVPYQPVDAWYKNELKQNYEAIKKYQQESYYHGTWKPAYDQWVNLQAGWTMSPEYSRVAWNSALLYDMIFTQPVCYEFEQVQVPTLLIIGELDRTAIGKNLVSEEVRKTMGQYPQLGRETQQKIKGSKLVLLPGIGHAPHIEAFDRFLPPLLDFLKAS